MEAGRINLALSCGSWEMKLGPQPTISQVSYILLEIRERWQLYLVPAIYVYCDVDTIVASPAISLLICLDHSLELPHHWYPSSQLLATDKFHASPTGFPLITRNTN